MTKIAKKKSPRPSPRLTKWDLQCMACHEAGHAICSYFLPEREKLILITIDPSHEAFGMIRTETRKNHNETEISLTSAIATFLAGRIAEEKILGIRSTSCIYDLSTARDIAKDMVCKFGMGSRMKNLAAVSISDNSLLLFSEYIKRKIDEDIEEIIKNANSLATNEIAAHQECLLSLSALLLKKKTLSSEEIEKFFNQEAAPGKKVS